MMETKPIYTLNARGNIFLEVTRDHFKLRPDQMLRQIQGLRQLVVEALATKGLRYEDLKSALVPDQKRQEIALVFDTRAIERGWYGYEVAKRLIPLFDRKSKHSVLVTDYSDDGAGQDVMREAMIEAVKFARAVEWKHSSLFYIVYINNLTPGMIQRLNDGMRDWQAYVGYADTTYQSVFKLIVSMMAVNVFIKSGTVILQGHEDDVPNSEDCNTCGYPFEENGYTCRSIQSILEGTMLSYKIERPVLPGFEVDTEMALNAVSETPLPLDDFRVELTEARLGYLRSEKSSSMKRANLEHLSTDDLAALIKSKVSSSYIYNMVYDSQYDVTKFNVILEVPPARELVSPTRLLAALKYLPQRKTLELITLY
jgi:hypothetical protein